MGGSSSGRGVGEVPSKVLVPGTTERINGLYDAAVNHEVMTDEELERRVSALLSRNSSSA
jgi:hypothetical protein